MKINISSLLVLTILFFASCEDWLDVKSEGTPNEANYWQTDSDYNSAMVGVYGYLGEESTWGRDLFWEQGASDDIFYARTRGNAQSNLVHLVMDGQTENSIYKFYERMYLTMAAANNVIYYALQLDDRTEVINNRLGEAYFMRAFAHFMIAYRHGRPDNGVPFKRYEDHTAADGDFQEYVASIPVQRATVMDNYALIIEDLEKAIGLLPWFNDYSATDYGRATKDSSIGLKVKALAYWAQHDASKWSEIPALVDQLENEGGRGLLNEFADVFLIENNWSKEFIWSVNSSGNPADGGSMAGSLFPGMMLDNKGWGRYNGWGNFKPTLELWAEFDENDKRRPVTIMQYGDEFVFFGETRRFYSDVDEECGFHFNKYMEPYSYGDVDPQSGTGINNDKVSPNGDRPTTDLNVPLIRFADMILFKAEAYIEMGDGGKAATELNRITTRAGLGNVYTSATIEDLMHERRCELAGEYTDRFMDLKRWAAKYPKAKQMLEAPKHGLKYENRSDPDSPFDTANSTTKVVNNKQYNGVIEIVASKTYTDKYSVFPYQINEVIKAQGALKQNEGYPSN